LAFISFSPFVFYPLKKGIGEPQSKIELVIDPNASPAQLLRVQALADMAKGVMADFIPARGELWDFRAPPTKSTGRLRRRSRRPP
jgi:hypothetical protein